MIQSGYCLIDLSWLNTNDYEQSKYYNIESAAKACRDLKAAFDSGKIAFVKLGATQPRVLHAYTVSVVADVETARIQLYEPSSIGEGGVITFSLLSFAFASDGGFTWKIGGMN